MFCLDLREDRTMREASSMYKRLPSRDRDGRTMLDVEDNNSVFSKIAKRIEGGKRVLGPKLCLKMQGDLGYLVDSIGSSTEIFKNKFGDSRISPDAPQPSNTTVEDFVPSETTEPEIRITYKRQTPKQDSIFCRNNENNLETDLEPESPVSVDAPANPISNSSRIINKKRSYAQLHLELGQSDFLLHTCSACGLKYARGEEGDEKVHKEYHKNSINGIKFKGWRHERVISADVDSGVRIILVLDDDPSSQMNKVREVLKMVEGDLGLCEDWLFHKLCKVYLFIASHRIAGCLVAEPIKTAYRVVSNFEAKSSSNKSYIKKHKSNLTMLQFGGFHFYQEVTKKAQHVKKSERFDDDCDKAIFCEEEAEPALCGVRAIWVAPSNRRNHVATKLLDAVRKSFCADSILELSQMAFSQPTLAGRALASSYCGTGSFLVYNTGLKC